MKQEIVKVGRVRMVEKKLPAIYNTLYTKDHVIDLIKRAIDARAYRDQSLRQEDYEHASHDEGKLAAYVELLESIVVFSIGDGIRAFETKGDFLTVSARLDSFITAFDVKGGHRQWS